MNQVSDDAHPAKRPRLSLYEPTTLQDSQYYFKDGNIVLSAHEDPDNLDSIVFLFRAHMTVLARQSTVFADMMDLPTPADETQDTYDGAPLLHLHDRAEHVRGFLLAIYDPLNLFLDEYTGKAVDALAGALILAHKYDALAIKDRIIKRIHDDWSPNDCEKRILKINAAGSDFISEKLIHLSHISKTRSELTVPLSTVYYFLSSHPESYYNHSLLTSKDVLYAMTGRHYMQNWICSSVFAGKQSSSLRACASCNVARYTAGMLANAALRTSSDSLVQWKIILSMLKPGYSLDGLCSSAICRQRAAAWLKRILLKAYDMIPEFFDIKTWDEQGFVDPPQFEPYVDAS
ncbi:hypothetical protein ONZ45_g6362 [Pleurotus djamor]|nr:hypothetical protein ONZ45_g6362 [Pleurotus djamor]